MTAAVDLAAADPLAMALAWLRSRPRVAAALGLADGWTFEDMAARIGSRNVAPYPRLILTDPPGGTDGDLLWLMSPAVQFEAVGDLDGSPGKAALRRLLYTALGELRLLPEQPVTDPTQPVCSRISTSAAGGWVPLPNGQPRYLATALMAVHPPVAPPA